MKKDKAKFLGAYINIPAAEETKIIFRISREGIKSKTRISQVRPYFYAPIKEMYESLKREGFVKDSYTKGTTASPQLIPKAQNN